MIYGVLVNKENLVNEDFINNVDLVITKNIYGDDVLIEIETLRNYMDMKEYLKGNNIFIEIEDAYRSLEKQRKVQEDFIIKYGKEYTRNLVAEVGTSEHHTGLALDLCLIVNNKIVSENEDLVKQVEIWEKIHSCLHDFGFILRYPKGKENITGYTYEPWHIRYVGKSLATEIFNCNSTLEEYYKKKCN